MLLRGKVTLDVTADCVVAIAGFPLAFLVTGVSNGNASSDSIVLFPSGGMSISVMVLPNISVSPIQIMLGRYDTIVTEISALTDAVFAVDLARAVPKLEIVP